MTRVSYFVSAGLLSTLAAAVPAPIIRPRQFNQTSPVTFDHITPSPLIDWEDCYEEGFQCTYLTVPLDYADHSVGTTNIAFIRYLVSEDAEDLLYNPGEHTQAVKTEHSLIYLGGPGGSGVEAFTEGGFGKQFAKQWKGYNPVSFDPRGVKHTKPSLACSYDSINATLSRRDLDLLGDMRSIWDESLERNTACAQANQHNDAKYVGTSAVVQDMVHFTEVQAAMKGKDPSKALINYYGVSYGTLIGQTLVAMYPERVRRVLLDGNVYGVAHYQGWEPSGIDDLAHGIWLYSQLCYRAGSEWCPLAEDAQSGEEVQARIDLVVEALKEKPLKQGDVTFDDTAYLNLVQQNLYSPRAEGKGFLSLAQYTIEAANGTASQMVKVKRDNPTDTGDAALGIITSVDIAGRYPWSTYEQWKAATEKLALTAPYGAKGYASLNG